MLGCIPRIKASVVIFVALGYFVSASSYLITSLYAGCNNVLPPKNVLVEIL